MTAAEHWLSVVGIGEDGWDGLNHEAKRAVESAELLYGGARQLALVPTSGNSAQPYPLAFSDDAGRAPDPDGASRKEESDCARQWRSDASRRGRISYPRPRPTEFRVIPQVSAFSLACARLGWPMAETTLITLVNQPIEQVRRHLFPGQRLVIFSEDGSTPATVARLLTESGYGSSRMDVFENLGGPSERNTQELAANWASEQCSKLNLIAVLCVPDERTKPLSLAPGLPDDTFDTDGQLTKREVRAVTLARLAPLPNQTLWDVGAGTGSIGIEWMRVHPSCSCIAFEAREDRAARIRENAARLGVPSLKVIQGTAPDTFAGLRSPEAIFIGGAVSNDDLFDACWAKLSPVAVWLQMQSLSRAKQASSRAITLWRRSDAHDGLASRRDRRLLRLAADDAYHAMDGDQTVTAC